MDTKYWGPSGWKLLHLIAAGNPPQRCANAFFSSLPYVLPCKYCRASLSEYILDSPIDTDNLPKWLYKIHNCVNAKLRAQKLKVQPDPTFKEVDAYYNELLDAGCTKTKFIGWEFLFSVAENHPYSRQSITGKPIAGCPEHVADLLEKNRWNLLTPEERQPLVLQFWESLPRVLPYPEWRAVWNDCEKDWSTRKSTLKTLWAIRCKMDAKTSTFASLCNELKSHRSGCGSSHRAKTCRKKRT
jgi:hypothetical protein